MQDVLGVQLNTEHKGLDGGQTLQNVETASKAGVRGLVDPLQQLHKETKYILDRVRGLFQGKFTFSSASVYGASGAKRRSTSARQQPASSRTSCWLGLQCLVLLILERVLEMCVSVCVCAQSSCVRACVRVSVDTGMLKLLPCRDDE